MIMTGSSLSHLDWPTNTPLITDSCTPYTVTLKELLIITLIAFPIGATIAILIVSFYILLVPAWRCIVRHPLTARDGRAWRGS